MPQLSVEPNEHVTFRVAHEDGDVLVVDKRAGLPTQPGKGHDRDTLLNGLFARYGHALQKLGAARDFGLLHRLDKQTSGLLIVGLSARAYDALRDDFKNRRIRKFYYAVCGKRPRTLTGVIELPIAERGGEESGKSGTPKLAHVSRGPDAKAAVTAYRVLASASSIDAEEADAPNPTLIEARPLTGRLHQVRVHLDAIGCPVLGDSFYGSKRFTRASPRLALHAHRVGFTHPVLGTTVDVRSPMPTELKRLMRSLGIEWTGTSEPPVRSEPPAEAGG
jgi:23S rRNA pseudouridine1911/1915/1917 synthase